MRLLGLLGFLAFAVGCVGEGDGPTSVPEAPTDIDISGRILSPLGTPVAGALVVSQDFGFADTTGADGWYHLRGNFPDGRRWASRRSARSVRGAFDRVTMTMQGQPLAQIYVVEPREVLRDVIVGRREIRGAFSGFAGDVGRVEAVVSAPGVVRNPVVLAYDNEAMTFGGVVFFPYFGGADPQVAIAVSVYGRSGALNGVAPETTFVGEGDAIRIPSFTGRRTPPRLRLEPPSQAIAGDSLHLHASVSDSLGGRIILWEWRIGVGGWMPGSGGDTTVYVTYPLDLGCAVRVRDNEGNVVQDSILVPVRQRS